MMISTRGRYALRVIIDLAEHTDDGYVPMREVAQRQEISLKYLERILPELVKNGFIEGVHGKGGGYRLCRKSTEMTVGDILRRTEGDLAPVSCLEQNAACCEKRSRCKTIAMWNDFFAMTNNYFDGITIDDLINGRLQDTYQNNTL